jgi:serine/threonine protein kinase
MELLGKGAFANVYRGRSKLTGLEVAIKMVCHAPFTIPLTFNRGEK